MAKEEGSKNDGGGGNKEAPLSELYLRDLSLGKRIPKSNGIVDTRRCDQSVVWRDSNAGNIVAVADEALINENEKNGA
jgi:hypothetical protein